ncbi:MAG: DUF169 domain-containing protein [Candidatus Bathyarchaeia archaeon]
MLRAGASSLTNPAIVLASNHASILEPVFFRLDTLTLRHSQSVEDRHWLKLLPDFRTPSQKVLIINLKLHTLIMDVKGTVNALENFKKYGEDIERLAFLRTYSLAIKLLGNESEIPSSSIRPKRDRGEHWALCQAFAVARRHGLTITMLREDHWCYTPLIFYGLVKAPESFWKGLAWTYYPGWIASQETAIKMVHEIPRLPYGKYVGLTCAPLSKVHFEPDVVMIYCNTAQLRYLLLALRYRGYLVTSRFDPFNSCVHSVISPFQTGECYITIPDPGDYERAIAGEDEIILSVPKKRLDDLITGLKHLESKGITYKSFIYLQRADFPQCPTGREYFKIWGLNESKK